MSWKTTDRGLTLFCHKCGVDSQAGTEKLEPLCYRCGDALISKDRADIKLQFTDGQGQKDEVEHLKDGSTIIRKPGSAPLRIDKGGFVLRMDESEIQQLKERLDSQPTTSVKLPTSHTKSGKLPDAESGTDLGSDVEIKPVADSVFVQRLMMVMKDNQYDRILPKRKKGKIDGKNVWKSQVGQINVFKARQERQNKEYHVVLAIDCSGSMGGDKLNRAIETSVFMNQSLEKAGIDVTVIAFNCKAAVVKGRDERRLESGKLSSRIFDHYVKNDRENDDFQGLELAMSVLSQDQYGKVLMVFSDGSPAPCGSTECQKLTGRLYSENKALNQPSRLNSYLRSFPTVTSIGVGIVSRVVEKIYPKYVLVDDLNDFKAKIIHALSKCIVRG